MGGLTSNPPWLRHWLFIHEAVNPRTEDDSEQNRTASLPDSNLICVGLQCTCINRSISVPGPPLWNKLPPALRQISESSYELTQTSPFKISLRLFHSKLKTLLFSKSYPDLSSSSSPPSLSQLQTPSTIAV